MESINSTEGFLPPALIDAVEALAAAQQRPAREVLREAVETYVRENRPPTDPEPKRTPQQAAARMLELRKGNILPEGVTIRDLMTYGRR